MPKLIVAIPHLRQREQYLPICLAVSPLAKGLEQVPVC